MYKAFLIKYAEIGVKGKNRFLFEDALMNQIRFVLKDVEGDFNVRKEPGRIFVETEANFDYDETLDALKHVLGIVGICPLAKMEDNGFEDFAAQTVDFIRKEYDKCNFSFKVKARSARKNYPLDSM